MNVPENRFEAFTFSKQLVQRGPDVLPLLIFPRDVDIATKILKVHRHVDFQFELKEAEPKDLPTILFLIQYYKKYKTLPRMDMIFFCQELPTLSGYHLRKMLQLCYYHIQLYPDCIPQIYSFFIEFKLQPTKRCAFLDIDGCDQQAYRFYLKILWLLGVNRIEFDAFSDNDSELILMLLEHGLNNEMFLLFMNHLGGDPLLLVDFILYDENCILYLKRYLDRHQVPVEAHSFLSRAAALLTNVPSLQSLIFKKIA